MKDFLVQFSYTDLELRAVHRETHLAYLEQIRQRGTLLLAGPFDDESGAVLVLRAEDEGQIHALMAADPYARNGVQRDLRVQRFTIVLAGDLFVP